MGWTLEQIDTPALVIDLEVAEANLRRMQAAARARGLCLWPHTKTLCWPHASKKEGG